MSRYTVTNLRAFVAEANAADPLPEANGYGNLDRYKVQGAYGGYQVQELFPNTTAAGDVTHGYTSAREAAEQFSNYLVRHGK